MSGRFPSHDRPAVSVVAEGSAVLAVFAVFAVFAVLAAFAVAAAVGLSGCGEGSPPGRPSAGEVPLVARTRVLQSVRVCDGGAHPYCARELVVAGPPGVRDPGALTIAERTLLHDHRWHRTEGETYDDFAAESPGNGLRVTYATAEQDLLAIDEGRITRAPAIVHALSQTLFRRQPALSVLVQAGSG